MSTIGLIIGAAEGRLISQLPKLSNRHGIISGATGTGKTVTLQILAEGFSRMGVPVLQRTLKVIYPGSALRAKLIPRLMNALQQFR